jgi:membrane associated rhomboid family serine protease
LIPLRDNQPTSSFPIVTIFLITANILVYVAQQIHPLLTDMLSMMPYEIVHNVDHRAPVALLTSHGPARFIPIAPHPFWITIFTSMFLHGNLLHIGGNMLFLWIFGNNIEDVLGKLRYIVFYFVCGIVAAGAQVLTDLNSTVPMLGASGAIAGVLGAYYLLYPNAKVLSIVPIFFAFVTEVRAWLVLGLWFLLQVFQGVEGLGDGVAVFAHIGGFLAGILLILMWGGRKLVAPPRRRYYTSDNGAWS